MAFLPACRRAEPKWYAVAVKMELIFSLLWGLVTVGQYAFTRPAIYLRLRLLHFVLSGAAGGLAIFMLLTRGEQKRQEQQAKMRPPNEE